MDAKLEAQALALLEAALEADPSDLAQWLAQQPDLNAQLRQAVTELLAAHTQADGFLRSPPILSAPDRVGPYRIIRPLSEGGMGTVFLARRDDGVFDQDVAVKLIRVDQITRSTQLRQSLIQRFESERQILARLNHPNIARIIDGGTSEDGQPYLVMELVHGEALTVALRDASPARVLQVMIAVCDAVQEAHRNLIVHRDLKPENILLDRSGQPRLLDFGIAKILASGAGDSDPTVTGLGAMTPAYASPEQIRLEPVTTASDVYSLGVLLYELLSGQRPYQLRGVSPADAQRLICETEPPPPSEISRPARPGRARLLRGDLDNIVLKAMHKDPRRRYRTAAELADDLNRYVAARPVAARRRSWWYLTSKFLRRNQVATALGAIALATAVTAGTNHWRQAEQVRAAAEAQAQMNSYLIGVLANSDPFTAGRDTTLAEALTAAEETLAEHFTGKPLLEAQVRHTLGYAALGRNDLATAERNLKRASELLSSLPPGHPDAARTRNALAWLSVQRGRVDEAAGRYRDAIQEMEQAGTTNEPIFVTILSDFGLLNLEQLGDLEAAGELLTRAQTLAQTLAQTGQTEPRELITLTNNLGRVAELKGDDERALGHYDEAITLAREALPAQHPNLAVYINNRGVVLARQKRFPEALALLAESLAMRQASFGGADHPKIWNALLNLGTISARAGDAQAGLKRTLQALAMAERLYPEPHANLGISLVRAAQRQLEMGDAAAAADLAARGRAVFASVEGNHDFWIGELDTLKNSHPR
ncbi:MAG: serine/threonine-protein kinase [Pseudomonadota bacterium]